MKVKVTDKSNGGLITTSGTAAGVGKAKSPMKSPVGSEHHLIVIDTIDSKKNLQNSANSSPRSNHSKDSTDHKVEQHERNDHMMRPESYVPVP